MPASLREVIVGPEKGSLFCLTICTSQNNLGEIQNLRTTDQVATDECKLGVILERNRGKDFSSLSGQV